MNEEQLYQLLIDEGYPSHMMVQTINKLVNLSEPIKTSFENWYLSGELPVFELSGYTYQQLVSDFKMKPVGAFLTLDWLLREPYEAKIALSQGRR